MIFSFGLSLSLSPSCLDPKQGVFKSLSGDEGQLEAEFSPLHETRA
jgi:hypothetical protein